MRNVRTDAPVIVTGEDTFTERSHLDRSIILHLKKGGRNEKAMAFFDFISPITLSYLKFLVSNRYTEDPIITKKLSMEGGKSDKLNDRQLRNLWTIQFGHRLLNQWLSDERIDYQIPDLSWDMLIADSVRDAATNPILDLIWWAHDMHHSSAVILNDDVIYIHPMELMRLAKSPSGPPIQLPFSSGNALRLHLIDEYDALPRTVNSDVSKVPVRMYEMDVSKVEQME